MWQTGEALLLVMEIKVQAFYLGFSDTTLVGVSRHLLQPESRSLGSPFSLCFLGGPQCFLWHFAGVEHWLSKSLLSWEASPSLLLSTDRWPSLEIFVVCAYWSSLVAGFFSFNSAAYKAKRKPRVLTILLFFECQGPWPGLPAFFFLPLSHLVIVL